MKTDFNVPWITVHPTGLWSLGCTDNQTYKVLVWGVSDVTFQLHFLDLSDNPINGDPIQGKVLIHSPPTHHHHPSSAHAVKWLKYCRYGVKLQTAINRPTAQVISSNNFITFSVRYAEHSWAVNYEKFQFFVVVKFSWITTLGSLQIWNNSWVKSTSYLILKNTRTNYITFVLLVYIMTILLSIK